MKRLQESSKLYKNRFLQDQINSLNISSYRIITFIGKYLGLSKTVPGINKDLVFLGGKGRATLYWPTKNLMLALEETKKDVNVRLCVEDNTDQEHLQAVTDILDDVFEVMKRYV